MQLDSWITECPSPCYLIDEEKLIHNAQLLARVGKEGNTRMLLALKAFACFPLFPLIRDYLDGVCASGPWEARLGYEFLGKEVHTYNPAFSELTLEQSLLYSDHISLNSISQWTRFTKVRHREKDRVSFGLRVNPEVSSAPRPIYDPCSPQSRLGVRVQELANFDLSDVEGFHIHALCEQDFSALLRVWESIEKRFKKWLPSLKWLNLGGGHHITREGYDVQGLIDFLKFLHTQFDFTIYLEPGEAWALQAGFLVTTVEDIVYYDMPIAILDVSCTCHMPDVLEMPYRPTVLGEVEDGWKCRLAGCSCLAGDVIGEYRFSRPLQVGDRIVFTDMAHYTMVKTTFFNGIQHPAIASYNFQDRRLKVYRIFDYSDFRSRLG